MAKTKLNVDQIKTINLSDLTEDSSHRTVTDAEKVSWNNKQNALGYTPENINNKVSSFQTIPDNTHYPSEKLVKDNLDDINDQHINRFSAGWISGGVLSTTIDNLLINISSGVGYAYDGVKYVKVEWGNFLNNSYVTSTYNFVSIKYDGTLQITASEMSTNQYIKLGKFWWDASAGFITVVWNTPTIIGNYQSVVDNFVGNIIGATVNELTVSEKASPDYRQLIFSAGILHVRFSDFNISQTSRFVKILQCADLYVIRDTINDNNTVDTTLWADKTKNNFNALTVMTDTYWAKALIVVNTQGLYYYVYPEAEYPTESEARAAPLPFVQPLLADDNACICAIIFQKGDVSIANRILDIRPNFQRVFGTELFSASGATVSHNSLLNLDYLTSGHTGFTPSSREINGHALNADVTITKTDLSLENVDNIQQLPLNYLDTDITLNSNSDVKVTSQKAIKTYVDNKSIDVSFVLATQIFGG